MKYEIGQLDRRITFIAKDEVVENEIGEIELGDREVATVWAKVEQTKGKERIQLSKVDASVDYTIICRFRSDINQTMEINYNNKRLEILSVTELGRGRYLEILAIEMITENERYNNS